VYVGYWFLIVHLVLPGLSDTRTLILWLASTVMLALVIGALRAFALAGVYVFLLVGAIAFAGAPSHRLRDARTVAIVAFSGDYDPSSASFGSCANAAKFRLPAAYVYDCRAGYCRGYHPPRPVPVTRITVTHDLLLDRWVFTQRVLARVGGSGLEPHGTVNPHNGGPQDCSAFSH
jgi:hypothetical protein